MKNYYQILGVGEKATKGEIKAAFKKLAVKYHPDKNPDNAAAEEKFKEINAAHQTLSDTDARWRYDQSLSAGESVATYTTSSPRPQTAPRQRRRAAPGFRPRPQQTKAERKKEERMGCIWTVAIIVIIAIPVFIYTHYKEKAEEELGARASELYHRAKKLVKEKEYRLAFSAFENDTLKLVRGSYNLKKRLLKSLKKDALRAYQQKDNAKSLELHLLVVYYVEKTIKEEDFYLRMAECYAGVGNIKKAEKILDELENTRTEYETDFAIVISRARIYTHAGKLEKAKKMYYSAADTIISHYIKDYGSAYYVSMNPRRSPKNHYTIFCEKGMLETQLGNYKEAERSLSWAIKIRPKYSEAYYQKGILFFEQNRKKKAYKLWKKASNLGSVEAKEILLEKEK